jgi:hypothetical protein
MDLEAWENDRTASMNLSFEERPFVYAKQNTVPGPALFRSRWLAYRTDQPLATITSIRSTPPVSGRTIISATAARGTALPSLEPSDATSGAVAPPRRRPAHPEEQANEPRLGKNTRNLLIVHVLSDPVPRRSRAIPRDRPAAGRQAGKEIGNRILQNQPLSPCQAAGPPRSSPPRTTRTRKQESRISTEGMERDFDRPSSTGHR